MVTKALSGNLKTPRSYRASVQDGVHGFDTNPHKVTVSGVENDNLILSNRINGSVNLSKP